MRALTTIPLSFPRSALVSLLLLPLLWLGLECTRFRTRVELNSYSDGISIRVNGQEIQKPIKLSGLKSIAIDSTPSFFPNGCESLILSPKGQESFSLPVPRKFKTLSRKKMIGDWWTDESPPVNPVFREQVDIPGDFQLAATFSGRTLGSMVISLEGERKIQIQFRTGSINNDFGVALENGSLEMQTLNINFRRDLSGLIHSLLAALFAAFSLIAIFGWSGWFFRCRKISFTPSVRWHVAVPAILALGTLVSLWMAWDILEARPHFQDDMGYLLRAKWLLAGKLYAEIPKYPEFFQVPFTFFINGKWMSQYPVGWPLLLALGQVLKAPWIISPLCGLVLGFATWKLGTECGGKFVGLGATTLGILSPLGIVLASSMMSHTATAMWLALFFWLFVRGWRLEKRSWPVLGLSGLALGLAFTTRPLSGFVMALPAGIYGLCEMRRLRFSRTAWTGLACFLAGGVAGALPQLIDNSLVTGNPLLFAYTLCKNEGWSIAAFPSGLFWADKSISVLPGMAFGWGFGYADGVLSAFALGFALIPFVLRRAIATDWLLLGICLVIPVFLMGYQGDYSLHGFGPRYYVDIFFALFVLSARGFQILASTGPANGWNRFLALCLFGFLCISTLTTLPGRLALYKGYNDVDARYETTIRRGEIEHALILLGEPKYLMWISCSTMFSTNMDADLIFAELLPDNQKILDEYAGRPVFLMDYSGFKPYLMPVTKPHEP